jgi:L-lysine exporter family protein LysE/ArgO
MILMNFPMIANVTPFLKGLATMAALIIAIGVQNAFVLRQGLKRQAAFTAATVCFLCDATLVTLGTAGLGAVISTSRSLSLLMAWGGAVFLAFYGLRSLYAARRAQGLDLKAVDRASRAGVIFTALAVSLLNPHAIIDTVVLVGGLAGRYEGVARIAYASGAVTASGVWFYGLAYGARGLAPILTKPKVWRIIDSIIGLMMLSLAIGLAWDGFQITQNRN